jgi:hypothetical protein
MMKSLLRNIFLMLFMALSFNAYGWNAMGHMVVANIAYQHVTPVVRVKLDKMIATFAKEYPQDSTLTKMSSWPDALRGQKIELYTHWHYIDLAISMDGTPTKNLSDTDNAVWAINLMKPILQNAHANPYEQSRFLAFMVHVVGDLHQPLHTVSRISAAHPDGDKGGNLFTVRRSAGNGAAVSLHKIWDDGAGFLDGDETQAKIDAISQLVTTTYPEQSFGVATTDLNPEHWAKEGFSMAAKSVYATPEGQVPSTSYTESEKKIVQQQLALAGYRLANLLNLLLADKAAEI